MAPYYSARDVVHPLSAADVQSVDKNLTSSSQLTHQWSNPNDILSLLLLVGPNIVQKALAQLAGGRISPVAFSFGWVAYSISALFSTLGDQRLMPPADFRALVIGAKSGHAQNNGSWVVGRLLRDYEKQAKPHTMIKESMSWEALRISVFKIRVGSQPGRPRCDWVWYSGFVIAVIQIIIALIPLYLYSEWIALFVTITGTLLAFSHGALPQWKKEKWETAKSGGGTVTITQGNGSRHAMVILGSQDAMDLEILAYRDGNTMCTPSTRIWCAVHTVLWLVLVVTVAGLKRGTWFLLINGTIGMLHNLFVAGCARHPEAFGINTDLVDTITGSKVSTTLARLEDKHPLVGTSLLPIFYPAGFRPPAHQKKFWKAANQLRHSITSAISVDLVDEASILSESHPNILEPVHTVTGRTFESRI